MPLIEYVPRKFSPESLDLIKKANSIIKSFMSQGFRLSLRQIYYQFVKNIWIPNTMKDYKRLGSVINDARLAGMIDWSAIEDRTRETQKNSHWLDPEEFILSVSKQLRIDKWDNQPNRCEVWIEKEALAGVVEGICRELDIPFLSCRGYTSQSEMWSSAMRLKEFSDNGQTPIVIHLGDHDPSGIDMSRDIEDRIKLFVGEEVEIRRIALNMDQVTALALPPNPAKQTDARFVDYMSKFGDKSWELDALDPQRIVDMIRETVEDDIRDPDLWDEMVEREAGYRREVEKVGDNYDKVKKFLSKIKDEKKEE